MSIFFKFKAATQFEALPLPGTAARLFDIKKAIVKAKRLDASPQEFDLSIKNATTNEEYIDETMWIPRGTRVICARLPAARGHGLLDRIAGHYVMGSAHQQAMNTNNSHAPTSMGLYDISSHDHDDDEEFEAVGNSEKELAALMAVTEASNTNNLAGASQATTAGASTHRRTGPSGPGGTSHHMMKPPRLSADPELRDQEQKNLPKKRATGIPRTFLNLTSTNTDDAATMTTLQPNTIGFEQLKTRGGGQSALAGGSQRDLDYALKVTATSIPDHLQCAICMGVVHDAMLLPWDPEGRTACETCIRDALTQQGFKCPLTGNEGVSPDDLLPNMGLRKAVEHFIGGVMEKIQEIDREQPDDIEVEEVMGNTVFEGDAAEKGVIVSKKTIKLKPQDDDDFDGDADFGGDVFAVEADDVEEKPPEVNIIPTPAIVVPEPSVIVEKTPVEEPPKKEDVKEDDAEARREARKQRAPPAGYAMGPAGGRPPASTVGGRGRDDVVVGGRFQDNAGRGSFRGGRGRTGGRFHQDRVGGGGGGGGGGRHGGRGDYDGGRGGGFHDHEMSDNSRHIKRPRSDSQEDNEYRNRFHGGRGGDGGRGGFDRRAPPPLPYNPRGRGGGPFRGGRGGGGYPGRGGGRY